jgi:hypothetical protein
MIGIFLQALASFFGELSGSLGKWIVKKHVESIYTIGFQNSLVSFALFLGVAVIRQDTFRLDPASFPTLALLIILAIAQAYGTLKAMSLASRGTFNFIRTGTMPLLLVIDLLIGINLTGHQIAGIIVVMCALLFLFLNHGIEKKGAVLTALTALNAAACISLYKWHVTVWNSVVAEQMVLIGAQMIFFLFGALWITKENPFRLLRKQLPFLQSASHAGDAFIGSFAYLFAPASVILAATRSFAVLWGIIFGNRVFHEKGLALKIVTFVLITIGVFLMV